jgi:RimJ/RimL family protein N-acetyltransferase
MVKIEILPLTNQDLKFFSEVRNSCAPEFLHDSRQFTLEETIFWFEKTKPEFYLAKVDGENVGYFRTSNLDLQKSTIYIGCDIKSSYRGKGYGYILYKNFIPFIKERYKLKMIYLEVLSSNKRAIGLYQKLGFQTDTEYTNKIYKNGILVDSIKMSLVTDESIL